MTRNRPSGAAPQPPRRSRNRRRSVFVAAAAAGVVIIAVIGWTASRRSGTTSAGGLTALAGQEDPGLAHVHGLGIDPSDAMLYAATHFGLFRIPENGSATRIANRY